MDSRGKKNTVRSNSGTMTFSKRVVGPGSSSHTRSNDPTSNSKTAQLWSAVALQQHMLRSIHGLPNSGAANAPAQPRPGKLTLAEKMGLVEAPPLPPTECEWDNAVTKSLHRNDCDRECSICQVGFVASSTTAQVILSCSHVFHEQCIKQFEKFVRRSGATPSCPICRASRYHKRVHYQGMAQVQHHAAAKIQALVRGVQARKRYLTMRLRTNKKFRIDYAVGQLKAISDGYTAKAAAREKEIDRFIEELDLTRQKAVADMFSQSDWASVRNKILTRHDGLECPICMATVDVPAELTPSQPAPTSSGATPSASVRVAPSSSAVMLSCAHCFHAPCLESFERFATAAAANSTTPHIPRCPVCRAGYARKPLVDE